MVAPVIAEMFMKSATSLSQVAATGKVATDKAFQKIFDSTMQNTDKALQNVSETNEARRSESETSRDATRETSKATTQETDATRERTDADKAASAKADKKNKKSDDSARDTKKADEETVADKLEKLKKNDPKAYNAMIANLDNMTLGNLLSTLGLNASEMSGLKPGVDLAGAVPENLKLALKSGDLNGIGSALADMGIGGAGDGASVAAFAGKANMAIAGAKGDAANNSSANMKNDSQTATTAPANDSATATPAKVSTTEVSSGDSKQQAGSSGSDNGSQGGSSNADNGNGGLAANLGSSPATGANSQTPETRPEVKAVDPFNLADPAAANAAAQTRTDGASQQAQAKPAITVQNQTNEVNQASPINTQTSKSDQTQAAPDARPANAPRQNFERMVLDQVVDKARFVVRPNGASSMVIKLDPPTLGKIDMRVEVKEGVVRAAIVADNHDVKHAIEGNIETLKQSLHANGLKVDEISVTVGGENGFQFKNDNMAQNAGSQNQGDGRRAHHGQASNTPVATLDDSGAARVRTYAHSGLLNVVA